MIIENYIQRVGRNEKKKKKKRRGIQISVYFSSVLRS